MVIIEDATVPVKGRTSIKAPYLYLNLRNV